MANELLALINKKLPLKFSVRSVALCPPSILPEEQPSKENTNKQNFSPKMSDIVVLENKQILDSHISVSI